MVSFNNSDSLRHEFQDVFFRANVLRGEMQKMSAGTAFGKSTDEVLQILNLVEGIVKMAQYGIDCPPEDVEYTRKAIGAFQEDLKTRLETATHPELDGSLW